jgi:hypothetical protein
MVDNTDSPAPEGEPRADEAAPAKEHNTQPKRVGVILRSIAKILIATVCGVAAGVTVQVFLVTLFSGPVLGSRDFVVYWATGQQLAHHANPYDGAALLRIERAAGLPKENGAMFMRNPPTALPLAYPLGFLGLRTASMLWSLLLLACLAGSVRILWVMHGRPKNRRVLLGYSFGPALICLINGQASLFVLLGLVLFLRLHRARPFLAGVSLWLCALKPHLFLPFGVVLLAWIAVTRSYRLLAGASVAIAASCAATYAIDPHSWAEYLQMARTSGMQSDFIPCLSFYLRLWINPNAMWLQYLPAVLGCIWALYYFWPRRRAWDWMNQGSPLMLVSILAAPYSWLYDQVLVIPALLQGAFLTRSWNMLATLAVLSALVEGALFGNIIKPSAVYLWTTWTAPAWLVWYLLARATAGEPGTGPTSKAMKWLRAMRRLKEPALETGLNAGNQGAEEIPGQ